MHQERAIPGLPYMTLTLQIQTINYENKGETLWFCYLCVCDDTSHPFLELAFPRTQTCFKCVDSRNIPLLLDFYLFLIILSWLNLEREVCFRIQTCLKCGDSKLNLKFVTFYFTGKSWTRNSFWRITRWARINFCWQLTSLSKPLQVIWKPEKHQRRKQPCCSLYLKLLTVHAHHSPIFLTN